MSATFKSHVLRRDEKGFAGIPFKRLLLGGCGGGLALVLVRVAWPDASLLLGIGVGVGLLVLTAPRGGLPRWQRSLYGLRGRLLLARFHQPTGALGRLSELFGLPTHLVELDGGALFSANESAVQTTPYDWVAFAAPGDLESEERLALLENPPLLPEGTPDV
jgi:hypothetical protein